MMSPNSHYLPPKALHTITLEVRTPAYEAGPVPIARAKQTITRKNGHSARVNLSLGREISRTSRDIASELMDS